jgi:cytochrome c oxidase subunit 2
MRRVVVRLFSACALLTIGIATAAVVGTAQTPQVIKMTVKKFEYSVKEFTVKKGAPVVIEITSEDRVHGFSLPDFGQRSDVVPGQVTRISFTPDKIGTFEYLCDVFCGEGHEDVSGTITVTD